MKLNRWEAVAEAKRILKHHRVWVSIRRKSEANRFQIITWQLGAVGTRPVHTVAASGTSWEEALDKLEAVK